MKTPVLCAACWKPFTRAGHDRRSKTCSEECKKKHIAQRMKTYRSRYSVPDDEFSRELLRRSYP